ncbi:MAG TPA: TonB-dependent receptor plug domain-containing protein, partial [Gemmatimonadaceae bacterium]|nr:TonB-dependent receptor plug domain-containing protein [Gemmatimonadaceae bacterium]
MKNLGALLVAAGLALLPGRTARAQQAIVVSGTVRSEANAPILGASVGIMSLGVGAMTNEAGHYSFIVPADRVNGQAATLVVRRIGFRQASAQITLVAGAVTQDFTLAAAPAQLEEVVTTALGIEKSKKSLGYAQQSVDTTELNRTRSMNIANSLEGKVAGLQVTGATTQGGSARVVIRGASSISQGNEPLYVVDGIPINNSNFNGNSQGYGGYDYGNAAQDINPDDIADVSVLKGPTAAALYGSRAANGAILI